MGLAIEVIRPDTGEHETFACAGSPVRIGRSPLNNVVLAAPWVSLHHGLIHFDDQRATYSDLGSTNGTVVLSRGQELKLHPMVPVPILAPGHPDTELRIGVITMRVRWEQRQPTTGSGGVRGFDTRLTHSDAEPPRAASAPPSRPEAPVDPGRPLESPSTGRPGPSPAGVPARGLYQAGHTRMVMPGEQERVVELGAGSSGAMSGPVHETLARLTRGWNGAGGLHQPGPERAFAETLAAVADAFARGLIELKKGVKEFGEGMGVRAVGGHSPLHRSQSASEVLGYLLDPHADTHERLEQLVDLFADLMIHEVAVLAGVKAGVRKLLTDLDPEREGRAGLLDRGLRRYAEQFKHVTEDDGEKVVFGPEFARAYADALGTDRRRG